MKKLLLLTLLLQCFACSAIYGQYGLQASILAPTGYYQYVLKPAVGAEFLIKSGDMDDIYSFGGSIGYAKFNPTQDTFRTYATGGQGFLFPGYEVIHSYQEISVGVTNDLRLLPERKICPVIGFDLYFYVITVSEDDYAETIIQSSSQGDNYWLLSILPRVGVQYKINESLYLTGGFGRSMSLTGIVQGQVLWKTFFNLIYCP